MASASFSSSTVLPISLHSPRRCCSQFQALALNPSQFLSPKSVLKLSKQILLSPIQFKKFRNPKTHAVPTVVSAQSSFLKEFIFQNLVLTVLQTVWRVGKDGIEAGTNLVPDSIPRPLARISVTVVALTLSLFVLQSFLSTAFFVLAMMGLIYLTFRALNKDEGRKGDGGTASAEDSLEEARRIMEKYK